MLKKRKKNQRRTDKQLKKQVRFFFFFFALKNIKCARKINLLQNIEDLFDTPLFLYMGTAFMDYRFFCTRFFDTSKALFIAVIRGASV